MVPDQTIMSNGITIVFSELPSATLTYCSKRFCIVPSAAHLVFFSRTSPTIEGEQNVHFVRLNMNVTNWELGLTALHSQSLHS